MIERPLETHNPNQFHIPVTIWDNMTHETTMMYLPEESFVAEAYEIEREIEIREEMWSDAELEAKNFSLAWEIVNDIRIGECVRIIELLAKPMAYSTIGVLMLCNSPTPIRK